MNILSLFDGMSCGQQALERAGLQVDNYFASEIDKYAIQVTMANYPSTIQIGSVVDVDGYNLPKIDLLIGGSPCQSFSFAGKRKGMATKCETEILTLEHYLQLKKDGFEFEGQSYLFWEYMRLLNEVKPKYFLLENVMMGEKWEKILSKAIGVNPIMINSSLVSGQNRKRLYWTNIGMESAGLFGYPVSIIKQPKDKGILLKDILQDNPNAKFYLSGKMIEYVSKSGTKDFYYKPEFCDLESKAKPITTVHDKRAGTTNYICEPVDEKYFLSEKMIKNMVITNETKNIIGHSGSGGQKGVIHNLEGQSSSLCSTDYKQPKQIIVHNTMPRSSKSGKGGIGPLSRNDGKTYCLDTGNTNAIEVIGLTEVRTDEAKKIRKETGSNPKRAKELIERTDGKTGALLTSQTADNLLKVRGLNENQQKKINPNITSRIRRLTPKECERLQTVKDNYTNHVSDSQRYKMLGNGWTVDVIAHIFKFINEL
jgi:DNA (cytosine-5)-methyltransferase 3A